MLSINLLPSRRFFAKFSRRFFAKMSAFSAALLFFPMKSFANPACAVCTIAIGASLGIARRMGVQDCIVGLYAGAMLAVLGYWTIKFFDSKNWRFYGYRPILMLVNLSFIGFTYLTDLKYTPCILLHVFYTDAFLLMSVVGFLIIVATTKLYAFMKQKNGGHAHFPFEKVVLPVAALALMGWAISRFDLCTGYQPFTNQSISLESDINLTEGF